MAVHEMFAYLCVRDTARAIEFYTRAFGAREKLRLTEPSGRIGHAELDFGAGTLMLSDEFPEFGITAPAAGSRTSVTIHIHVDDADEVIARAREAGATIEMEPKDEFYGERSGCIRDPFGHRWNIGHQIEKMSADEMQRRYTALLQPE
jgi:PhnB protein